MSYFICSISVMPIDMSRNVLNPDVMVPCAVKIVVIHALSGQSAIESIDISHPSNAAHTHTHTMYMHMQTHVIKSNAIQSGVLQSQ